METYTSLDLKTQICSKDYGTFMSKDNVACIVGKIVKMQEKVKQISEVSYFISYG